MSRLNGRIYHLHARRCRGRATACCALLPGAWLMAGYDWLYGWRAEADA